MNTIYDEMKKEQNIAFKKESPLSTAVEIVLFKQLERLYALQKEGYLNNRQIVGNLIRLTKDGFKKTILKDTISALRKEIKGEEDLMANKILVEALDTLLVVQNTFS